MKQSTLTWGEPPSGVPLSRPYPISAMTEVERLRWEKKESEYFLLFGTFEYNSLTDTTVVSDGFYRLFDYEPEAQLPEVNYMWFLDHLVSENKDESVKSIEDDVRETTNFCLELDIVTVKNKLKHIQIIGCKIPDESGLPVIYTGIIRDITTKYLQQQHLKSLIKELERSNKELEEFAYIASHDLQEPLRKISIFTERLQKKLSLSPSDETLMYMDRICASADSMRILIDNLLDFSRVSRSEKPFVNVSLNKILNEACNDLELIIEETGTRISASELPVLPVIPAQMKQLFYNIISNAIKFRKQNQPQRIHISSSIISQFEAISFQLPLHTHYHKIIIKDEGIGIETEYLQIIFQIFQRLHGKSEYPGSGIGLAICKKIVDQHGGVIYAESEPQIGSSFIIILPNTRDDLS
jgi:signal transduction histidine kinase